RPASQWCDALRKPGTVRDFNAHAADGRRSGRRLETAFRHFGEEAAEWFFLVHAKGGIVIAAHAGIRDIGRAAIEDLVVGGRLVRVRADNGADAAIDEMGETHLLAGGFGVEVYDNGVGLLAQRAVGKLRFDRLEG